MVTRAAVVSVLLVAVSCSAPRAAPSEPGFRGAASTSGPPTSWTVELSGFACGLGEGNELQGYASARIVRGCCDGRCFAATLDGDGKPTGDPPHDLGIPALDPLDEIRSLQGVWPQTWVALRDRFEHDFADPRLSAAGYTEVTLREVVYSHGEGRWTERYRSENENIEVIVGIGPWLGGATIAAIRPVGWESAGQRIEVLMGDKSTGLPPLPPTSRILVVSFASLSSGHAFAIGSANGRLRLLRWAPGSSAWLVEERDDLGAAQLDTGVKQDATLVVRSMSEAYAATRATGGTLKILRFDGARWTDSGDVAGMFFGGYVFAEDGATWALTSQGEGAGVWRRAAGQTAGWSRVAGDVIGDGADIEPVAILPAARQDVLVVGKLRDKGWGLYRVKAESSRH